MIGSIYLPEDANAFLRQKLGFHAPEFQGV